MRSGEKRIFWAARATALLSISMGCGPAERASLPSGGLASPEEPSQQPQGDTPPDVSGEPGLASLPMDSPRGGQSGTEEGEPAPYYCPWLQNVQGDAVDPEQYMPELGATPLEVARQVLGTQAAGSGAHSVVLELNEFLGTRRASVGSCVPMVFDFRGRAFASEKLLLDGRVTLTASNGPLVLDWLYSGPESPGATLTLALNGSGVIVREAGLYGTDVPSVFVGASEWEDIAQRRRAPELEQACAAVRGAALDRGTQQHFASPAEAGAAIEGTWVTCDGNENDTFAGMVIQDGHWHHLVRKGDVFEAQRGFEHEGAVEVRSLSAPDDPESLGYSVQLTGQWGDLGLSLFPEGLRGYVYTWGQIGWSPWTTSLVRVPVEVSEPTLPQAPDGRAGESACATGESGVLALRSSDADPVLPFVGRWQRCSGPFPELLEFDAQGGMRVLSESGEVLSESYAPMEFVTDIPEDQPPMMVFTAQLDYFGGQYTALFSETPRKLWLGISRDVGHSREPNDSYAVFAGVYSAVP